VLTSRDIARRAFSAGNIEQPTKDSVERLSEANVWRRLLARIRTRFFISSQLAEGHLNLATWPPARTRASKFICTSSGQCVSIESNRLNSPPVRMPLAALHCEQQTARLVKCQVPPRELGVSWSLVRGWRGNFGVASRALARLAHSALRLYGASKTMYNNFKMRCHNFTELI
jgi:hypothetical protein